MLKNRGGVFGRHPTFGDVDVNTLTSAGNQTITNGNLVIGTAGKGIDFSADGQASGMTSELLDDYEEGTWTPTFTSNGTTGTVTTSFLYATYTKVGQVVHVQMSAGLTVTAAPTGAYLIITLPFARKANTSFAGTTATYNLDLPAGAISVVAGPINESASDSNAILLCPTDNGAWGVVDPSTLVTGDQILFGFSYIAA